MCPGCRNLLQIFHVVLVTDLMLHIFDDILVLFLKHLSKDTILRLACLVILFIMSNLINKEQRQNLNPFIEQLAFSFDMRQDSLADLNPAQLLLTDFTDYISGKYLDTINEFYRIISAINRFYNKAVLILRKLSGIIIKVKTDTYLLGLLLDSRSALHIKLDCSGRICFRQIYTFQIYITVCSCGSSLRNSLYGNLLNQTLIISFHGIQAVNHVVDAVRLMSS